LKIKKLNILVEEDWKDFPCWQVWGLSVHTAVHSFAGEHARSSFFKNIGQGVTQLHVDSAARLFSCGADGSMKVRQLPERDLAVQTLY
jgi:hypothetical protein